MKKFYEFIFYVSIAAGMALGTSSFLMVSVLSELTTNLWMVLAILVAGGVCIVISKSVAELASMYPSSPGIRTYLKFAFGNQVSLFLVYMYLIFMILIAGVESYMFGLVIHAIFPAIPPMLAVMTLLAAVIVSNLIGLELPRGLQILTAAVLILCVLSMGVIGLIAPANPVDQVLSFNIDSTKDLISFPAAAGLAIYLFIGFEWVTPLGFRPESYKRRIPRAMPVAIITNMITYSFLVIGMGALLTRQEMHGDSIPQVAYFFKAIGPSGLWIAGVLSVLAIFSTFNAGIMGGSRLIFMLTREGNLPKWCGKISLTSGAPIGAVLLLGGLAIISSIFVVTYELEALAAAIGTSIVCFIYAGFLLAVFKLRKTEPDAERPFQTRVPKFIQWAVVVIMPGMGIMGMVADQPNIAIPIAGFAVFAIVALLMTRWSVGRASKQKAMKRQGFTVGS